MHLLVRERNVNATKANVGWSFILSLLLCQQLPVNLQRIKVRCCCFDCCNSRYYHLRLLANKKWGPSPATLIQIYRQCVRPIFEYGSLSTITTSANIITQIQRLQNKFIRLALRLPKYICTKLLHDSTGLPYVKDRLLSCATKSLDRIAQNPLIKVSISRNRLNPAWVRRGTPLV